jgi:hypothetical protein
MASNTVNLTKQVEKLAKANKGLSQDVSLSAGSLKLLAEEVKRADRATKTMTETMAKRYTMSQKQAAVAVKRHQSELVKQGNTLKANQTRIDILKAKLKDHGVVVGQVTNWENLRTQALQGNKVAISRLNRAVNTAIATERKRKRNLEQTVEAVTIATHGWKKYFIAMRGGNVGPDPGGPLGVRNLRNVNKMGGAFSVLRSKLLLTSFAFGLVNRGVVRFVQLAGKQEAAEKKVTQAIISTGAAAGLGTTQLVKYAQSLQQITTHGDEAILSSSALLLTFKDIKGGTFLEAQKMILNVSDAMGQDLKTSTIQVGKALNDPIKGIGALNRVGIQFTNAQKIMIRNFQEGNEIAKAQAIILAELESQFGGMAEAVALTAEGSLKQLNNAFGDMGEEIGENLAPLVLAISENLKEMAESGEVLGMKIETLLQVIIGLGVGFAGAKVALKIFDVAMKRAVMTTVELTAANHALKLSLARSGIGLAVVLLGELAVHLFGINDLIGGKKGLSFNMGDFAAEFGKLNEETRLWQESQLREELTSLQTALASVSENTRDVYYIMGQAQQGGILLSEALAEIAGKSKMTQEEFTKWYNILKSNESLMKNQLHTMVRLNQEQDVNLESVALAEEAYRSSAEAQAIMLDIHIQRLRALAMEGKLSEDALNGLAILEDKLGEIYEKLGMIGSEETQKLKTQADMLKEIWTENKEFALNSIQEIASSWIGMIQAQANAQLQADIDVLNSQKETIKSGIMHERAKAKAIEDIDKQIAQKQKEAHNDSLDIQKLGIIAQTATSIAQAYLGAVTANSKAIGLLGAAFAQPVIAANNAAAALQIGVATVQGGIGVATIDAQYLARGGDFITDGPQALVVGDNPGGREHVQVTPLSSPNFEGPQGGGVNITFSGNILSQDFIEDEAIPMIKEAIRRGADIGVS